MSRLFCPDYFVETNLSRNISSDFWVQTIVLELICSDLFDQSDLSWIFCLDSLFLSLLSIFYFSLQNLYPNYFDMNDFPFSIFNFGLLYIFKLNMKNIGNEQNSKQVMMFLLSRLSSQLAKWKCLLNNDNISPVLP